MAQLIITRPAQDATYTNNHGDLDYEKWTLTFGSVDVKLSEAAKTEIKKCIDLEVPKTPGYKSHEISITAQAEP